MPEGRQGNMASAVPSVALPYCAWKGLFLVLNWTALISNIEQNNCLLMKSSSPKLFVEEELNLLLNVARCCDSGLHTNSTEVFKTEKKE